MRVATPVGNSAKGGAPPVLGAPTGTAPPGAAQERASPISDAAWERHHAWHAECWAVQVMKPEKPTERDVNQGEGNRVAALHYNDQLREFVIKTADSYHHQAGSCKMGLDDISVVDPQLRVYGVEGLRVADASVMPQVPSGNCNAGIMMIAEKVSDLIKTEHNI